jgi:LmbE family N-acetylglucosaminyl deacetylase
VKRLAFNKVLALSPHPDDIEFGCGATIHRLARQGSQIKIVAFSLCEESLPKGLEGDTLEREAYEAASHLGVDKTEIRIFQFPVRNFQDYRQEILENLIRIREQDKAELVLAPSSYDIHQDHKVIYEEAVRAFRYTTMLGYESPWNNIAFATTGLVEVSREDLEAKKRAIACYRSQNNRHYKRCEFFNAQMVVRGIQNKTEFAEAFEAIRLSL